MRLTDPPPLTAGSATGSGVLRELNRRRVLDAVKRGGPLSRVVIARETGLAKPTTNAIVEELVGEGVLRELAVGPASHAGGRRPVLYDFNPRSAYVLGVHVGVEATVVVLADAVGVEVGRRVVATAPGSAKAALGAVVEQGRRLLGEWGVARAQLAAAGVAVPGLVEPQTGVCLLAPNLGWEGVDVVAALRPLGTAVMVTNVAQAVLAAEHREGACRHANNVVLLYEANGVGAAMLVDGRLVRGARGIAGELGHCKLPGVDDLCACGARGCLETRASVPALMRRAAGLPLGVQVAPGHEGMRQLADLPAAAELVTEAGASLGHAAGWLVNLLDPEVLVVAGGFVDAGPAFLAGLRATLREEALPQALTRLAVRVSELREEAPIRGAVLLALRAADAAATGVGSDFEVA